MDRALSELSTGERLDLCYESLRLKDEATASHCSRVAVLVDRLAGALGVNEGTRDMLRAAALIHDVGKAAMPAAILTKPAPLDADEWDIMKQHPAIGARLARRLQLPSVMCDVVHHHHEHFDGSGYPQNLRGRQIPLSARVLSVVDVYDALTCERSYRPAFEAAAALRIMREESGTTLDPQIFRAFGRMLSGDTRPEIAVIG